MHHEQIFKFLGCIKICKDSTWTKTRRNKIMQPITSNNNLRPVFPYHVYNQADFDNPFINWRRFMFWHYKDEFHFYIFTAVQDSILIKAARKANIWWHSYYCSSWKSCFKIFEFKVSGTKRDVVPNDRFPSAETISMWLLLLFPPGQPQDRLLWEVLRYLRSSISF